MARAYIVVARNDLPDNLLQVLDLKPNSSHLLPAYDGQNSGQTGYQTHYSRDAAVNSTVTTQAGAGGGASVDSVAVYYGLAAYLLDVVEDQVTLAAITAAVANATKNNLFTKVAAGTDLTAAEIADSLVNNGVANAGAGTTLTAGNSTGAVETVLRILAGEVWRLPALSQVTDAAGNFDLVPRGAFVSRPNVMPPASVEGTYGPVRGRKSTTPLPYLRPGEVRAGQAPVQTGTEDVLFRDVRVIVDSGELHLSELTGALSHLTAAGYAFLNTHFTYAGGATPAQTIGAANIAATGVAAALRVYDASGNII